MGALDHITMSGAGAYGQVEDDEAVTALASHILAAGRSGPIVAVTTRFDGGYILTPEDALSVVSGYADVYAVKTGDPTRQLSAALPARLDVYGGAMRIWYPGAGPQSNVMHHPLLLLRDAGLGDRARFLAALEEVVGHDPQLHQGVIAGVVGYGAFVEVDGQRGLIHISNLDDGYVEDPAQVVGIGDTVRVRRIPHSDGRVEFTLRGHGCGVMKTARRDTKSRPARVERDADALELQAVVDHLQRQVETLNAQLADALEDRDVALSERRAERDRAQALSKEVRSLRDRVAFLERRGESNSLDDAGFIGAVDAAYRRIYSSEADRVRYPFGAIRLGPRLLETFHALEGIDPQKVFEVCAHVASGRAPEIAGLEVHPLKAGKSAQQRSRRDGGKAWRCSLQVKSASARRLHYWIVPGADGPVIEFDTVGVHDAELDVRGS